MALKGDIYKRFDSKTTEELQKIWAEYDREEYADITFEVIEEILKKRNVSVKARKNTIPDNQSKEYDKQSEEKKSSTYNRTTASSLKKYPALYSISKILNVSAYAVLLISIGVFLSGLVLLNNYDESIAIIMITSSIFFGFFGFISILAFSELIKLFLDIEKNTRK